MASGKPTRCDARRLVTTITYSAPAGISATPNVTYLYDGRVYDAENRMTKAWANNQWQEYTYNADGQRVRRKVDGVETRQIYGMDGERQARTAVQDIPGRKRARCR